VEVRQSRPFFSPACPFPVRAQARANSGCCDYLARRTALNSLMFGVAWVDCCTFNACRYWCVCACMYMLSYIPSPIETNPTNSSHHRSNPITNKVRSAPHALNQCTNTIPVAPLATNLIHKPVVRASSIAAGRKETVSQTVCRHCLAETTLLVYILHAREQITTCVEPTRTKRAVHGSSYLRTSDCATCHGVVRVAAICRSRVERCCCSGGALRVLP
jgi:hypothetical protein